MPTLAEQLKDEGLSAALSGQEAWAARVKAYVYTHLRGREVTGEEIRLSASYECGHPRHSNAWGAITNALYREGWLEDTGHMRRPVSPRSHARRIKVWRVLQSPAHSGDNK